MKKIIYPLFLSLLLVACSQQQTQIDITTPPAQTGVEAQYNEAFLNANEAQLFFKEDQSIAYFEGVGNEFAAFTETTRWLSDEIVEVILDNGGAVIHRYFSIKDGAISLLTETADGEPALSLQQLVRLPMTEPIVHFPLAVGDMYHDWHITDLAATVHTPYKTFEKAILFEKVTANETNRIYVVRSYGIVKKEFIVNVEGQEEMITSSLSTIDYER